MKQHTIMIVACLLTCVGSAQATDEVTITGFKIAPGQTKDVSIELKNDANYVAFQFDLALPDGITIEEYQADRTRVPETTTLAMARQDDGSYRFIAVAYQQEPLAGNSGGIITITVTAASDLASGNMTGCFRKIKLSEVDGTGPAYAEMSFPIVAVEPSTITANSYTREYGDENPTFGYTVEGGELEGEPEITCEATATTPTGTYPIKISKGSIKNYYVELVDGTLTITKAPLKVTAQSYTRKQGEQNPEFELLYEGWKLEDNEWTLAVRPAATTTATTESTAGTYPITVSGGESDCYDFEYVDGILTIEASSGIATLLASGQPFDVYTPAGCKIRKQVTTLKDLPRGVYIVNGLKVVKMYTNSH